MSNQLDQAGNQRVNPLTLYSEGFTPGPEWNSHGQPLGHSAGWWGQHVCTSLISTGHHKHSHSIEGVSLGDS